MRKCLVTNNKIFQCVYVKCYTEIFVQVNKRQQQRIQQLPPVAADKEEMFSTQKKLENSKSDNEFIEKTKEKVMTKKIPKRKEKR